MKKKISILSGGLDSTILTYKLVDKFGKDNVIALSFNYGQKHDIEVRKAIGTCEKLGIQHKIIDISFIGDIIAPVSALSNKGEVATPTIQDVIGDPQPPTYVPFRNMFLTTMAFTFAESNDADEVYMGLQVHDEYSYWDTSQYFIDTINEVSKLNRTNPIQLVAPFAHMAKFEEINLAKTLNVPFEDTWTCYDPKSIPTKDQETGYKYQKAAACGTCPSCSERIMNFAKSGIKDPVPYVINIDWNKLIEENRI